MSKVYHVEILASKPPAYLNGIIFILDLTTGDHKLETIAYCGIVTDTAFQDQHPMAKFGFSTRTLRSTFIPLSIHDLQAQLGTPSIYVFDCSAASTLLEHFDPLSPTIVLAACGGNKILPMNPEFPADIFTSCLTTPITIALRWFISQNT